MTAIEKRKLLEFIDRCVRYDLLSDTDVNKILDVCGAAVDRKIKKSRGGRVMADCICPYGTSISWRKYRN